jgi:hypothetical protein
MALWRDPLDELIADLERTLPNTATAGFRYDGQSLLEIQFMIADLMKGPRIPIVDSPDDEASSEDPTPSTQR